MLLEKVNYVKKIYVFYLVSHCAIVVTQRYAFSHQNNKYWIVTRTACQKKSKLLIFRYNRDFFDDKKVSLGNNIIAASQIYGRSVPKSHLFFF